MGRLALLASKSEMMEFDITYNGKRYKFNMYDELKVKENSLNTDIKSHATSYSFLTQLLVHFETLVDELEKKEKLALDSAYIRYKKLNGTGGRPLSDDLAKAMANKNKVHQQVLSELIAAKHNKNRLLRAVRSYEHRKDLIQSLSANLRNEK